MQLESEIRLVKALTECEKKGLTSHIRKQQQKCKGSELQKDRSTVTTVLLHVDFVFLLSSQQKMENASIGQFGDSSSDYMNATSEEKRHKYYNYKLEWILCSALTVPLGLFALYVAIMQIAYCIMQEKGGRHSPEDRQSSSCSTDRRSRQHGANTQYGLLLNIMSALASVFGFLRAGIDFRWFYGQFNDFACDLSIKFKLANYVLAIILVYLVLWLRQRVFYQHPRLKHLSSRLIRFISWVMSALIVLGMGSTSILFFAVGRYLGSPLGCIVQKNTFTSLRWYILIVTTTFFQICLLTLFVYPLIKHSMSVNSSESSAKKNPVIPLVKRAAVTAAVCVATDIAYALIILVLKNEVVVLSTFLYDVNVITNVLSMIFSFPDWKVRLMPWRITAMKKQKTEGSTENTSRNRTSESVLHSGPTAV